jgi:hypothetical protein
MTTKSGRRSLADHQLVIHQAGFREVFEQLEELALADGGCVGIGEFGIVIDIICK